MPKCRVCNRYFKTRRGFNSHLSMVRRTGRHYSSGSRTGNRSYSRGYTGYRRRRTGYRRRRY